MFGINYEKLKTNLKLSIQRLKLIEKKKTENTKKNTKEIADFVAISIKMYLIEWVIIIYERLFFNLILNRQI
jgi:hypothetical protein